MKVKSIFSFVTVASINVFFLNTGQFKVILCRPINHQNKRNIFFSYTTVSFQNSFYF